MTKKLGTAVAGMFWRLVRALCRFRWFQPAVGVMKGLFAPISWNATDSWWPSGLPVMLSRASKTKFGFLSLDSYTSWNGRTMSNVKMKMKKKKKSWLYSIHIVNRPTGSLYYLHYNSKVDVVYSPRSKWEAFNLTVQASLTPEVWCCWTASVAPSAPSYRATSFWPIPWWAMNTKVDPKTLYSTSSSLLCVWNSPRHPRSIIQRLWATLPASYARQAPSSSK